MQYLICFLEGITTFISPCLLPMLPVYISYFAGGEKERSTAKTLRNVFGFILGFTLVFVLLGALASTLGALLHKHTMVVNLVTGGVVVVFGLHFLGVLHLDFLFRGIQKKQTGDLGFFSSFLFGIVFSVGWTPCVGAFLGSALMLASEQGQVLVGVRMLILYALGLGLPFMASAILLDKLRSTFAWIKSHYRIINIICGVSLVLMGGLMMSGLFGRVMRILG